MTQAKASEPEKWAAQRIIELLEAGELPPWRKTWKGANLPQNMKSRKGYRGLNLWMLMMAPYGSPLYLTWKQIAAYGGQVKEAERKKWWPVYFWGSKEYERDDGSIQNTWFCKGYKVWNIEQTEGIPEEKIPDLAEESFEHDPIEACEAIVQSYKDAPKVSHGGGRAFYQPSTDEISMPPVNKFETREAYFNTLFHEYGHSTGAESRLKREGITDTALFGDHSYSQEELVAEFAAAMLCAVAGIANKTIENSASYIQHWAKKLKADPEILIFASRQGNKAAHHIQGTAKKQKSADEPENKSDTLAA